MAIRLVCPSCNRTVRVPDELVGKAVRCPSCLTTFPGSPQPDGAPGAAGDTAGAGPAAAPSPSVTALAAPDISLDHPESPTAPVERVTPLAAPPASQSIPEDERKAGTRPCPFCGEQIGLDDARCRYCGEDVAEEAERPWEHSHRRPVRRDCEPHRGQIVLVLGIISLVVTPGSVCCYGIPSLIGLALAIPAWVLGRRDLEKMRQGLMDPEGQGITQGGMICGIIGTILNAFGVLFGIAMVAYVVLMMTTMARMPPPAPPPVGPPVPVAPPARPPANPPAKPPAEGMVPRPPHDLPRLARTAPRAPEGS
jgi:hypothetical protein